MPTHRGGNSKDHRPTQRATKPISAIVAIGFMILVALSGGASRSDAASLMILRPLAALAVGYALIVISREQWKQIRIPGLLLLALAAIVALQLVPLPHSIWLKLPERDMFAVAEKAAGVAPAWRSLSVDFDRTLNSLMALLVPAAAMLLFAVVPTRQHYWLLITLIAIGIASAVIGLLQLIGPTGGPLYFYRITNSDSAVGLFANRNHQAILSACIIPLLAAYAFANRHHDLWRKERFVGSGSCALLLIAMTVATGSRAGLMALGIVTIGLLFLIPSGFKRPRGSSGRVTASLASPRVVIVLAFFALGLLVVGFSGRSTALDRILVDDSAIDLRFQAFETIIAMVRDFFPFGGGFGTFAGAFRIVEPDFMLSPKFLNHAHNDLAETLYEGGLAMGLLLIAFVVLFARAAVTHLTSPYSADLRKLLGRASVVVLTILSVASLFDYPLRTPTMAMVAAFALCFAFLPRNGVGGGRPS